MARTWLSVRVELLGGRGEQQWPYPGRVFAVGPSHTFGQLARAVDDAFARWDHAHLCQFTLPDGMIVADEETISDQLDSPFGPIPTSATLEAKVAGHVAPGEEFRYVFDFGDDWSHCCSVDAEKVDPVQALGVVPRAPMAYWGWGRIPDQYGRRWEDDSGEDTTPRRPRDPHPMLFGGWPTSGPSPAVEVGELREATFDEDPHAVVAAIEGRDIDDLLQHAGAAIQVLLAAGHERAEQYAVSVVNRLNLREAEGDDILGEDLLAQVRGVPIAARRLAVDLSELAEVLEGDPMDGGGFLDLQTGEVYPHFMTDPGMVGEDLTIDVEEDLDRYLALRRLGSRDGWRDMAAYAARVPDEALRHRLETAIEGRGAFRRFKDELGDAGLLDRWFGYSDDRKIGRARSFLAGHGIRAAPRR